MWPAALDSIGLEPLLELTGAKHDGGEQPPAIEAMEILNDCWKY